MTDWTKKPLAAARQNLAAELLTAISAVMLQKSARQVDDALKRLEKAIAAFRDNER